MRAVYFYYNLWPEALEKVRACSPDYSPVFTGPDTGAYWWAFAAQWTGKHDLVTIEQDVLIHDGVMDQFAACPHDWCAFGWDVGPGQRSYWWLGCTKFSAKLQQAIPVDLLCRPNGPAVCGQCSSVPCHRHLDRIFAPIMDKTGRTQPHKHTPPITHLRTG